MLQNIRRIISSLWVLIMKRVRYRQLTDIHSVLGEGTRALLNFIEKHCCALGISS